MLNRQNIPPVQCLIAFQQVARGRSFTLAADSLGLTQGAVSKQIGALETFLGISLFARAREGLTLTAEGASYLADITPHLEGLGRAGQRAIVKRKGLGPVRIKGLAALSDRWLLPRLGRFLDQNPGFELDFSSQLFEVPRTLPEPDIDIRFGCGDWPDVESRYLVGAEVALVMSQSLLTRHGITGALRPGDVLNWPRLFHQQAPDCWLEYRRNHQLPEDNEVRLTRFELFSVLVSSAMSGFGAALVPRVLISTELATGTLINPGGIGLRSAIGYHLCWHRNRELMPATRRFVDWLMAEARQTEP